MKPSTAPLAAFFAVLLLAGPVVAQAKEWTPMQMMLVKRISGVQVSPDGKRVVFAVRQALLDAGRSEFLTQVHVANADGTGAVQLTQGDKSCDDPQWSPDGKWIAFGSTRAGKRNLWLIAPAGEEPVQLTHMTIAVTSFKWSPDSKSIAFTASDGLTPDEEKAKKEKNDARVVDENIKMSRLYLVSATPTEKQTPRLLTKGNFNVAATGRGGYDWTPEGESISFTHTKTPHADDWTSAAISTVKVADGTIEPRRYGESKVACYSPLVSPNGRLFVFIMSDDPPTWAGIGRVCMGNPFGGIVVSLADTFDGFGRFSEIIGWSADNKSAFFTEIHGTVTHLGRLPTSGPPEIIARIDGVASGIHLNATRTHFGFSLETTEKAPEAYISPVDRFEPKAVSAVNAKLPTLPLGSTEVIRWKSKDGLEIEGLLTYPANYEKGKRYPLLLNVHGGPAGLFTQSFVASPGPYPIAAFSARGYAVLRPNPRGSSGYGKKFRYANYKDWGGGDYQDLMAGVDHVIKIGVADESRLGVMGWSYGGFMTSWTITQTKRFKAASVGAGVTNLMSFTGTADIPSFLPDYLGGEFWNNPEAYRKHSAMFNIKGVTTPTLIQHGERDERVPLSQGLELYNALKRQGCTTKMVIYPRTPHGIEEPRLLVECMERNLDWFGRYVGN
jgi:dipeptidyl aminopeptidase/acylaminoacyl peptidase